MDAIDWSQYAYIQYVTTENYLCNSVMIFESLARLHSKADRLMMYPEQWSIKSDTTTGKLLSQAREKFGVELRPVTVQGVGHVTSQGDHTWADSLTKLLAFNQTQYKRVLHLDSDGTILQHMDELFLLLPTPLAAPRAYWLSQQRDPSLSSQLLLIQPSTLEFNRILSAFQTRRPSDYDMEIINHLYNSSALVLPHRPYNLLTGEFKPSEHNSAITSASASIAAESTIPSRLDHTAYLGSSSEIWDPDLVINEAKYVHFSDWPVPKPWSLADQKVVESAMPRCTILEQRKSVFEGVEDEIVEDCRDREIWLGLYADFQKRRREVCGLEPIGIS
ncbi:glycosyltransferase family 8 protein [Cercospora zeae-maydis SCOH1-5]|uniref:Glycosyltransferase family 8 protein n=1 Tax=Cercospora zeae-maydis SCOH1-5 TaxID=717836 RepID=A0A6A6FWB7_9PEZI|nr:glycosyltransferase family 8 protein [Cercospora zeae-maydis SCOH1-5]